MVFAAIATGWEKSTSCQPESVSLVKVALASSCPVAVHRSPMCVPVLVLAL